MDEPTDVRADARASTPAGEATEIDRFLEGDVDCAAETLRLIRAAVSSRGFYIPPEDRNEVVQETMMQLVRQLTDPKRERPRSFAAFVRTIAYRRCVDWMRRFRDVEPMSDDHPGSGSSPEASLIEKEKIAIGRHVLASLRPSCRELIRRYSIEGQTFRQIAEADGRLEKTVRNQMYKCLDQARGLAERVERRARLGIRVIGRST